MMQSALRVKNKSSIFNNKPISDLEVYNNQHFSRMTLVIFSASYILAMHDAELSHIAAENTLPISPFCFLYFIKGRTSTTVKVRKSFTISPFYFC